MNEEARLVFGIIAVLAATAAVLIGIWSPEDPRR